MPKQHSIILWKCFITELIQTLPQFSNFSSAIGDYSWRDFSSSHLVSSRFLIYFWLPSVKSVLFYLYFFWNWCIICITCNIILNHFLLDGTEGYTFISNKTKHQIESKFSSSLSNFIEFIHKSWNSWVHSLHVSTFSHTSRTTTLFLKSSLSSLLPRIETSSWAGWGGSPWGTRALRWTRCPRNRFPPGRWWRPPTRRSCPPWRTRRRCRPAGSESLA